MENELTINGVTKNINQWSLETWIPHWTIWNRKKRWWSDEKALDYVNIKNIDEAIIDDEINNVKYELDCFEEGESEDRGDIHSGDVEYSDAEQSRGLFIVKTLILLFVVSAFLFYYKSFYFHSVNYVQTRRIDSLRSHKNELELDLDISVKKNNCILNQIQRIKNKQKTNLFYCNKKYGEKM